MESRKWWVNVKTADVGGFIKVNVYAQDAWHAVQQAKAMYGDRLLSETAAPDYD